MGWFVIAVKPTYFEKTNSNAVEKYTYLQDSKKGHDIDIDFRFNKDKPIKSALKSLPQKGWIQGDDKEKSGLWKVSPFYPVKMTYPIIELDEKDYSYTVIGYPSREYFWIMYRKPEMPEEVFKMCTDRLVEKHGYTLDGMRKVPQVWTDAERTKRGFTKNEIPDDMLKPEESL